MCDKVQAIEYVSPPLPKIALIACTGTKLPLIFTIVERVLDRSGWTWQIVCPLPPFKSNCPVGCGPVKGAKSVNDARP